MRPRNSDAHITTTRSATHCTEPAAPTRLLTARDVQAQLRCSRAQAYGFLRHSIPVVRLGRSLRVRQAALDSWLRDQELPSGSAS